MLVCPTVQHYAWGKCGQTSAVAKLAETCVTGFKSKSKDEQHFAELWMGTHPKGPCTFPRDGKPLSDWLMEHPHAVGKSVAEKFPVPGQLPFLFKVLSVAKALSIQAHPTKKEAERLHKLKPEHYPDANHKPEMAIALTEFEALCGFRPHEDIVYFFNNVPEFRELIGHANADEFIKAVRQTDRNRSLQKCFKQLMDTPPFKAKNNLKKLVARIKAKPNPDKTGSVVVRLSEQHPDDVGCFCVYFLNYMVLNPGDSIFLAANLPHAYLSGDCIECMACSDNVVRAGLTPKFKDVNTLVEMLDYEGRHPDTLKFQPAIHPVDLNVKMYQPPIADFAVDEIKVAAKSAQYVIPGVESASIILCLHGGGSMQNFFVREGSVVFVPAGDHVEFAITSPKDFLAYRAYVNMDFFKKNKAPVAGKSK